MATLNPTNNVQEGTFCSTPFPALIICRILDDDHSDQSEAVFHCSSDCVSLMISDSEHLFLYLLVICMPSLEKCLFRSSAHFLTELLFVWYWAVWTICIVWKLIPYQLHHLQFLAVWSWNHRMLRGERDFWDHQVLLVISYKKRMKEMFRDDVTCAGQFLVSVNGRW